MYGDRRIAEQAIKRVGWTVCEFVFLSNLLGEADAAARPRLKGPFHRGAFKLTQHLASMVDEGEPQSN
jgi:hypothetical protein